MNEAESFTNILLKVLGTTGLENSFQHKWLEIGSDEVNKHGKRKKSFSIDIPRGIQKSVIRKRETPCTSDIHFASAINKISRWV